MVQRQTNLSAHIVAFCRHLRRKGYAIGPQEEAEALRALALMAPFNDPAAFQQCLKSTLARSRRQQINFDEYYKKYWVELDRAMDAKIREEELEGEQQKGKPKKDAPPSLQALKSWLYGQGSTEEMDLASYSAHEGGGGPPATFTDEQLKEINSIIQQIIRSLARQHNRRYESSRKGQFSLRQTLRKNMRRGGEVIDLGFRRPKQNRLRIVLLCDVSKSMDLYSQFLVQFLYSFQNSYQKVESFVFSTSLHRITPHLQHQEFSEALDQLQREVPNWSGGTKIGAALAEFTKGYGSRLLDRKTIVLVMSDGWDTGEVDLLAQHMRYIQRKAAQVIWINPLAGNPAFSPSVAGMKAAMPFIDLFLAAHDAESLRASWQHRAARTRRYDAVPQQTLIES